MLELTILEEMRTFVGRTDQSPCNGCDACGARCTEGVPMLAAEYRAILGYLESAEGEEALRVEQQNKRVPYPGTDDVYYTACRFRDVERGRCSIYPVRPVVCRLFGHVEWLPCPIEMIPVTPGGPEAMVRYGTAPQKTYEEWLSKETPR
jgi:Fe-S-cluster containining protein